MVIRDIPLTLASYPNPAPISVVDSALSLASSRGTHIAAV
jgi:hypothetical protein